MTIYLTEWKENGKIYGDEIEAESLEKAEQIAFMMEKDVEVLGELINSTEIGDN